MPRVMAGAGLITVISQPLSQAEVVRQIAGLLVEKGLVKDSYPDAVLHREASFPTGLPTPGVGVAIPHTDCEHVNQSAVAVGILRHPVDFQNMANPEQSISVQIIFMLAIDEPHGQIEMLQRIVELIQDEQLLQALRTAPDAESAWGLLEAPLSHLL